MASKLKRSLQLGLAMASALVLLTVTSAKAEIQNIDFVNTGGAIQIGSFDALPIPPDSAGMSIEWDDDNGDVSGSTVFNPIVQEGVVVNVDGLGDVTLNLSATLNNVSGDNVEGNIDPTSGEAELTTTVQLALIVNVTAPLTLDIQCTSAEFPIDWDTGSPDGVPMDVDDPRPYTMTLQATEITLPQFTDEQCNAPGVAGILNGALGGVASAVLPLEEGEVPPPPSSTTTTTSTSSSTSTTASTGGQARPRFTG